MTKIEPLPFNPPDLEILEMIEEARRQMDEITGIDKVYFQERWREFWTWRSIPSRRTP